MSHSRRVMNLIVENRFPGAKSLRYVDLRRQLFDDDTTPPPSTIGGDGSESAPVLKDPSARLPAAALNMEGIQLPSPIFTFQTLASALNDPCKIHCFPLAGGKTLWADQLGRSFIFDAEKRFLEFMSILLKPKRMPFSLFVPNPEADDCYDRDVFGSSLFVMERIPEPEASYQFEAFVYRKPEKTSYSKGWICQLLPPPPFVSEPTYRHIRPQISSYGVVGGGKHICISVDGVGSYCLNTENHKWSEIGKWTLPFHGKVEYVPELKLWFGLSAEGRQLAAADLSVMDSQPQLVRTSNQLDVPDEWKEYKDSQLVNLGSGRFCIARFFHAISKDTGDDSGQCFVVFTGLDVLPPIHDANCNASIHGEELELQVIPRKSICHMSSNGTAIDGVF